MSYCSQSKSIPGALVSWGYLKFLCHLIWQWALFINLNKFPRWDSLYLYSTFFGCISISLKSLQSLGHSLLCFNNFYTNLPLLQESKVHETVPIKIALILHWCYKKSVCILLQLLKANSHKKLEHKEKFHFFVNSTTQMADKK